ncbi:hypothetical protein ACLKA6_013831 [Drosophila palustris]
MNRSAANFLEYVENLIALERTAANGQLTSGSYGISSIRIWFSDISGLNQCGNSSKQLHFGIRSDDECDKGFNFGWGYLLHKLVRHLRGFFQRLVDKWKGK